MRTDPGEDHHFNGFVVQGAENASLQEADSSGCRSLLIGRTWTADVPVVADAGTMLEKLAELRGLSELEAGRGDRLDFPRRIRALGPRSYGTEDTESDAEPMHTATFIFAPQRWAPARRTSHGASVREGLWRGVNDTIKFGEWIC